MTDCARCGDCCDPVRISLDVACKIRDGIAQDHEFLAENWHPTGDWERQSGTEVVYLDVQCSAFDPIRRLCTAHADRPAICSEFPWYGREPGPLDPHLLRCSYLTDLPVSARTPGAHPLIPLTVVSRRSPAA